MIKATHTNGSVLYGTIYNEISSGIVLHIPGTKIYWGLRKSDGWSW